MSDLETLLIDECNVATRPASALTDHFESEAELVDAFRDAPSFTDYDGVGRRTSQKEWDLGKRRSTRSSMTADDDAGTADQV